MALPSWMYRDPALIVEEMQERDRKRAAKTNLKALFDGGDLSDERIDYRLRIPAGLDDRLENWGWLSRDNKRPGISQTGIICHRLAVLAGAYRNDEWRAPPTAAQSQDAHLIERAWRSDLLPMKQKMLLAGVYVYRVAPGAICRAASLRFREYDEQMYRACNMIHNIALRIARTNDIGDNVDNTDETTGP